MLFLFLWLNWNEHEDEASHHIIILNLLISVAQTAKVRRCTNKNVLSSLMLKIKPLLDLLGNHFSNGQRRGCPRRWSISDMQHSASDIPCTSVEHKLFHLIPFKVHGLCTNTCRARDWLIKTCRIVSKWSQEKIKGEERASPIHTLFHRLYVSSYF